MLTQSLIIEFEERWEKAMPQLNALGLPPEKLQFFNEDSKRMLVNFSVWFHKRHITPARWSEIKLFSSRYKLMGIIDAVHQQNGRILLVDYKTSKRAKITRDMFRQAAIYALLYKERFKKSPEAVGIHFLTNKQGPELIYVDDAMMDYAEILNESVHSKTLSTDPADYVCTCGGRCKNDFIRDFP